jgi:hypothetical protein
MIDYFPDMPSKVCNACKQGKKIMHFHVDKDSKDGRRSTCMQCVNGRSAKNRARTTVRAGIGERFNEMPLSDKGFARRGQ